MRLNQVTAPARDLEASVAFYRLLGLKLIVKNDHYARFELPEGEATFSLHLVGGDVALENAPHRVLGERPAVVRHAHHRAAALKVLGVTVELVPNTQELFR